MNARRHLIPGSFALLLMFGGAVSLALAQNNRPQPAAPVSRAGPIDAAPTARRSHSVVGDASATRREVADEEVILTFNDVSVEETFTLIMELTGKAVIPMRPQQLRASKITLVTDRAIPKSEAIDMIFSAFRLNDIGVVEKEDRIIIANITEIMSGIDLDVLGPDDPVLGRQDLGNFVVKIFRLEKAVAETIGEQLSESLPEYATLVTDANSNQIVLTADIGLCQHYQRLIDKLDETYLKVKTKTYRLKYADASEIADNIEDLFNIDATSTGSRPSSGRTSQRRTTGNRGRQQQQPQAGTGSPGPIVEMKLTVNTQQNTVTVQADPAIIEEVDRLVFEYWDLPRPDGTSKLYNLHYTDPIKVRDMLQELLEQGGGGASSGRRARGASGGSGGRAAVTEIVGGIYRIEAFPDNNSLLVLCKTEESFEYLDGIITGLDQPTTVGLPIVIELKHASATQLADELNVLLSMAGANITLERPDAGLSGQGLDTGDGGGGTTGATGRETEEGGEIRFPWQAGGRQREDQSPETPLIGKTRIVPIVRQNALAILAPPHYQEHVREIIQYLDRPGRQVMISAIIAEVELNDDFAFGVRFSATDIPLTNIDYSIGGNSDFLGTASPLSGLFDTSALSLNTSVNFVIQALAQQTNVQILQEPRVFTADNQEAVFFDGQDIPFITDSFSNNVGGLTQGFEYRQVGVVLNVRPRITAERDVEMEIYLELSSIVPGQTLFGGAIVDRRSTTSQITVKDGQTIVLSGILRDTESDIDRKVPLLGDVPLLGWLFRSVERAKVTTELVAFITPLVVDNPTDNDSNFNADERLRLEELRGINLKKEQKKVRQHLRDRVYTLPQHREVVPMDDDSSVDADTDKGASGTLTGSRRD